MPAFSTVPELLELYPNAFNPEAAKGMDGVVQLDISGEKGGTYYLEIADQSLDIEEGRHADPEVTIKTTAQHWLDIHRGEANPMSLMMQGEMSVSGSMAMATKFQNLFDV
ncbi:sterol-binding protein [Longibacter salinarum]|uniref:Sterol-binding protein n=1 Tax=Longibacter salinarum TaxID=1850348 RepID=A0A2A8CW20_9BACT|nr:SCP2 sterol-binding domain-containing protein [Longibacter salinarum]PEN12846.1 sterol-binding protein [Longibacter salinarum]